MGAEEGRMEGEPYLPPMHGPRGRTLLRQGMAGASSPETYICLSRPVQCLWRDPMEGVFPVPMFTTCSEPQMLDRQQQES